ncbi:putative calcineurin-like phosphoesterase domain, ApaH type, metallo-dependent phosphatase [Septoria linicola]|nr:putative calcineurin-like phosphoesterase domain, ApaH type, metallo-dependent phosphatase [Septoria linicola]
MATQHGKHKYRALRGDDESFEDDIEKRLPVHSWWALERHRICKMIGIFAVFSIFTVLAWGVAVPYRNGTVYRRQPLRFTSDGTFQISVFADLHFGENAWNTWGPQQDINSLRIIGDILDAEKQDLVVLNGDLITGENTYLFNSSDYLDILVKPIVDRGLPFASTYGNHDSSFNLSREQILGRERRYHESWTNQMVFTPTSGVSNYYLEVFPSSGGPTPCLILWFFDSRGGHLYQQKSPNNTLIGQPNWVDQTVVDWFLTTNTQLVAKHNNKPIPSLAFVHIPTNASAALQTELGVDPHRHPGINDDCPLAPQAQGWCANGTEGCPYGGQDEPFMQAITSTPGLIALFSGHDHGDTWCYNWDGLVPGMNVKGEGTKLCFGQHSGYGGYGSWERGAREILVREEDLQREEGWRECGVETWIRLEGGGVVGRVELNATFGEDVYPATERTNSSCPTCDYTIVSPMPGTEKEEGK